uniref:TIR domain-containing protein n=1 Tax=Candidatus Kentrum sp. TUN TaxID=2126343 RepID=A0A450ZV54_9GAMM|nr:MAG: TIR domain-containing protein [Candidatus Kentron sp. TUN]
MANLFLSHRKVDAVQAERLAEELKTAGHEVWFDEWKIRIGDSIVRRVEEGISGMSYLILCYSASGMSDWVDREWMSTLARQLDGHSVKILPVLLTGDARTRPAILADIKYADLVTDWDQGVQALLRAIR